jgi:hypothetical protein
MRVNNYEQLRKFVIIILIKIFHHFNIAIFTAYLFQNTNNIYYTRIVQLIGLCLERNQSRITCIPFL